MMSTALDAKIICIAFANISWAHTPPAAFTCFICRLNRTEEQVMVVLFLRPLGGRMEGKVVLKRRR